METGKQKDEIQSTKGRIVCYSEFCFLNSMYSILTPDS